MFIKKCVLIVNRVPADARGGVEAVNFAEKIPLPKTFRVRTEITVLIEQLAGRPDAFDKLEKSLVGVSKEILAASLVECGILPERFDHDSSEEKLWAKFSDILLAKALGFIGMEARVLGARGNSADVFAKAENYSLVGDAKTFRLSRTAKNQKDFKVNALDSWRQGNHYALLVCPLLPFPTQRSQIYQQAIERNVSLLSYTHLHFLMAHFEGQNLSEIWETGRILSQTIPPENRQLAVVYWQKMDETVCRVVHSDLKKLTEFKQQEVDKTRAIGEEGIRFWQEKIENYRQLGREEAIGRLIRAEKLESKIQTIRRFINQSTER